MKNHLNIYHQPLLLRSCSFLSLLLLLFVLWRKWNYYFTALKSTWSFPFIRFYFAYQLQCVIGLNGNVLQKFFTTVCECARARAIPTWCFWSDAQINGENQSISYATSNANVIHMHLQHSCMPYISLTWRICHRISSRSWHARSRTRTPYQRQPFIRQ